MFLKSTIIDNRYVTCSGNGVTIVRISIDYNVAGDRARILDVGNTVKYIWISETADIYYS